MTKRPYKCRGARTLSHATPFNGAEHPAEPSGTLGRSAAGVHCLASRHTENLSSERDATHVPEFRLSMTLQRSESRHTHTPDADAAG